MKSKFFLLSSACLMMLTACEQHPRGSTAPDNTGRNVRDREQTMTPGGQPESEVDRTITQKARQAIMDDDSLSTNAKNIKIVTANGVVTLSGSVNNEREKNVIGQKAKAIPGVRNVDNQLEITRNSVEGRDEMNR